MGPERMPELARTLGRSMWQLRKAANDFRSEVQLTSLGLDSDILKDELRDIRAIADDCPDNPANEAPDRTVKEIPAPEETNDSRD